jgi:hypothetical protein
LFDFRCFRNSTNGSKNDPVSDDDRSGSNVYTDNVISNRNSSLENREPMPLPNQPSHRQPRVDERSDLGNRSFEPSPDADVDAVSVNSDYEIPTDSRTYYNETPGKETYENVNEILHKRSKPMDILASGPYANC